MRYREFGALSGNSRYGLEPQFFPGVLELQKYGPAEAQESAATSINVQIKQQIRQVINEIMNRSQDAAAEAQNIYNDLLSVDSGVRGGPYIFKEAPMVPPHRKAHELVLMVLAQTPMPKPAPAPAPTKDEEDEEEESSSQTPTPAPQPDLSPLKDRIAQLQAIIAQKKAIQGSYKEQLAKEAKYTFNAEQKKPKGAAYATESEKIMGASTGYGEFSFSNRKLLVCGLILGSVWFLLKCKKK